MRECRPPVCIMVVVRLVRPCQAPKARALGPGSGLPQLELRQDNLSHYWIHGRDYRPH